MKKLNEGHAVTEAARLFEIEPGTPSQVGGNASTVYRGTRAGEPVILKVTTTEYRSVSTLLSELEFTNHLRKGGVPVSVALASIAGRDVETVKDDGNTYVVRAEKQLPGRFVEPREWTAQLYSGWGALLGKIHALTRDFSPSPDRFTRPDWQEVMRKEFLEIPGDMGSVREKGLGAMQRLDRLGKASSVFGLIHGDLHQWNLIWDGETLRPIDFDNCSYDWFAADLSVILHNVLALQAHSSSIGDDLAWTGGSRMTGPEFAEHFMGAFMKGYTSENSTDMLLLDALLDLLRRRHLSVLLDRWRDPQEVALSGERQAARFPYRSLAQHKREVIDDDWQVERLGNALRLA